jgi:hypothetical protein
MVSMGAMSDVAHHDAARVLVGLGRLDEAIAEQRLAARAAPPSRRSFQLWSLGAWIHFSGNPREAARVLARAIRWARRGRALLVAHHAHILLADGQAVERLDAIMADLSRSRSREGYGQYLLGMLAHDMGDDRRAAPHLRAFLRRNASADAAKVLTLKEELRAARAVLERFAGA